MASKLMNDRNAYHKARRDSERGGPARVPKPCGTIAAARRHQRAKQPLCNQCAPVWKAHQADMYQKRKNRMEKNA